MSTMSVTLGVSLAKKGIFTASRTQLQMSRTMSADWKTTHSIAMTHLTMSVHMRIWKRSVTVFAYVINASDLRALYALNKLNKYADDSYLIVPSINSHLVRDELDHISSWASTNNLVLNVAKSKE